MKYWLRFWIIATFIPTYLWRSLVLGNFSLEAYKIFWNYCEIDSCQQTIGNENE